VGEGGGGGGGEEQEEWIQKCSEEAELGIKRERFFGSNWEI